MSAPKPRPTLNPTNNWAFRIVALIRAGHSLDYILERGRYENSWTKQDVVRICTQAHIPLPPSVHGQANLHAAGEPFRLPPRQIAVLHHMALAATNAEIAKAIKVKEVTVKADVRSIIAKSGYRDRIGVVVAVLTKRLIPVEVDYE